MESKVRISKRTLACGVAAVALMAAGGATAQTAGGSPASNAASPSDANTVREVIVTANKKAERLHDVAMGITAVTGGDLQSRQLTDFTEFAPQVPGFNVQSTGIPGYNREILRGQNSGGAGATVATVIDEMPLSFSGSQSNAALTSTNLDSYDLQRVEVLKGPQGTLYGAAAEAGVIKFVTNPPDPTGVHYGIEAGGTTVDHGGEGGSVKGYLNIPFWNGKATVRATGFYEDFPGYVDNPYRKETDVNGARRYGGRVSLLLEPTSDLTVRVTASQQHVDSDGFSAEEVFGTPLTPTTSPKRFDLVEGYTNNQYIDQPSDNNIGTYSADVEYDLHWAKFSSITSYGTVANHYLRDFATMQVAAGLNYSSYLGNLVFKTPVGLQDRQAENLHKQNQEFRLTSEPGSSIFGLKIDWIGGVYYTHERALFQQALDFTTLGTTNVLAGPTAGAGYFDSSFEAIALFGQVDWHLTPTFDIAVGGRASHNTERLKATYTGVILFPNAVLPTFKTEEEPTTWSVAPRWQVTPNTLVYGRIATGYRPGGPNLVPPGAPPGYNYFYNSDSTINYEAGVRTDFLNHTVTVDLSAFYVDWSDIQILSVFTASNGVRYGATGNAGSASVPGIEYNFGWTPFKGLSLSVLGAWTDAHLTADASGLGAFKGNGLAYVPKWTTTLNADYTWTPFDGFKAYVGGTYAFIGSRYSDFSTSAIADGHTKIPSYDLLSLHAGLKKGPYTAELYAKNLNASEGLASYGANSGFYLNGAGAYTFTGVSTLVTPRTIGFRLAADF